MKFKAAVFRGPNKDLEIEYVSLARPLEHGQVLVSIDQAGLCGAQLQELRGEKNPNMFPRLMGHEGVGRVLEVGDGVKTVKVDDQVVLHWRKGSGIESSFPSYIFSSGVATSGLITTFADKAIISENRMTAVPAGTSNDLCTLLGCGLSTALSTINNKANVKFGESVLILGCGGVGLSLILAARLAGAGQVMGVDSVNKSKLLTQLGSEYFEYSFRKHLEYTYRKYDVIIDTTGNVDLIYQYMDKLSDNGRFILVGQPKNWSDLNIPSKVLFNGEGLSFSATQAGGFIPDYHIPKYIELVQNNRCDLNKIITDRFDLEDINLAVDKLRSGQAGRILIDNIIDQEEKVPGLTLMGGLYGGQDLVEKFLEVFGREPTIAESLEDWYGDDFERMKPKKING